MIRYAYDDGGREAAGYRERPGDCVVRAWCIVTGDDYREAYRLFAKAMKLKTGKANCRRGIDREVTDLLYSTRFRKILFSGTKPDLGEVAESHPDCVAALPRHYAAIRNGMYCDTTCHLWQKPKQHRRALSVWVLKDMPQAIRKPHYTIRRNDWSDGGLTYDAVDQEGAVFAWVEYADDLRINRPGDDTRREVVCWESGAVEPINRDRLYGFPEGIAFLRAHLDSRQAMK